MRFLLLFLAGCAQPSPPSIPAPLLGDPLSLGEIPLNIELLPGDAPLKWPLDIPAGKNGWLIPWHDAGGWHLRHISSDATTDRELADEPRSLVALDDGFAAATPGALVFFDAAGRPVASRVTDLDGPIATDGRVVLEAEDRAARLVSIREVVPVDLPFVPTWLWGDRGGFVLGDHLLSAEGELTRAPAPLLRDARIYFDARPGDDWLSLDGAHWIDSGGRLTWAQGTTAVTDQHIVLDLERNTRSLLPPTRAASSWLTARLGSRLVWEGVVGDDRAIALLSQSLVPTGGWVRVPQPMSREVVVAGSSREAAGQSSREAAGQSTAVLIAWVGSDHHLRYAVWSPEIQ